VRTDGDNGYGQRDEESISAWRAHTEHARARADGRAKWYESFAVHVARVERSYDFSRSAPA